MILNTHDYSNLSYWNSMAEKWYRVPPLCIAGGG